MNEKEIKNFLSTTYYYIQKKELKNAFDSIGALAIKLNSWKISDKLTELKNNYKYMLHYLVEGSGDPEQDNIFNQIIRSVYKLTDDAAEEALLQNSSSIFFEKTRITNMTDSVTIAEYIDQLKKIADTKELLSLFEMNEETVERLNKNEKQRENIIIDLFHVIFSAKRANEDVIKDYRFFINDTSIQADDKNIFISALMLNIIQRFDIKKILFLLECCEHNIMEISMRAIISLIPILQLYKERWYLFPEFIKRVSLLSDKETFRRRIIISIIQFIQSRETEKITKRITEDILPEMMKLSPIIGKKIKMDEWFGESGIEEKNPEWQKILDDAGITDKIEEFSNMQLRGADVFHSTFSNLKSYPFFYEMANWLLPFSINHSQLKGLISNSNEGIMKSITSASFICNSDKYSFCLSIMHMPEEYREMMSSQLGEESEQLKRMSDEELVVNPFQKEELYCKQYIQDLYRFYKLFPRRNDFIDIFNLPLNFHSISAISSIISIPKNLEKVALYYFEKNHIPEALSAYNMLSNIDPGNSEVWQKIGYCWQQQVNFKDALKSYLRAELIDPSNTWILRRIAQCYRMLKQPQEALHYYKRLEKLHPDDLNIKLNIGHCYLELNQYDDALENYFKVEWIDDTNTRVWRSIAWSSFLLHKYDVSKRYYQKILYNKPFPEDYLNAGHTQLCNGDIKSAVTLYTNAAKEMKSYKKFKDIFKRDYNELLLADVDLSIMPALLDQIAFNLE